MLGRRNTLLIYCYVIQFQNLIGMLGSRRCMEVFQFFLLVSKPYRYARKTKRKKRKKGNVIQFQNLIGMLGRFCSTKRKISTVEVSKPYRYARKQSPPVGGGDYNKCFKTLQVCQEALALALALLSLFVSKPYRYARKKWTEKWPNTMRKVSKPYRYARKKQYKMEDKQV